LLIAPTLQPPQPLSVTTLVKPTGTVPDAATTVAVCVEVAVAEPPAFVAVTATRIVEPTSPLTSVYA
jgi:hypothetical protein